MCFSEWLWKLKGGGGIYFHWRLSKSSCLANKMETGNAEKQPAPSTTQIPIQTPCKDKNKQKKVLFAEARLPK